MSDANAPNSTDIALRTENLQVYYGANLAVRSVD
jgi:hypothetical protein